MWLGRNDLHVPLHEVVLEGYGVEFEGSLGVVGQANANPPPPVRLLMEMADEEENREKQAAKGTDEDTRAAWERDADWWRGGKGESNAS